MNNKSGQKITGSLTWIVLIDVQVMMVAENKRSIMYLTILFLLVVAFEVIEGNVLDSSVGKFCCSDGICVDQYEFCNNYPDCPDHEDERFCFLGPRERCPSEEDGWLTCADHKRCYPVPWKCNGVRDCLDHSDEWGCYSDLTEPPPDTLKTSSEASGVEAVEGVPQAHRNITQYFLNRRRSTSSINKWGPHLLRTAVALFLADQEFFTPGNKTGEEISYEIALQLMSKLALKEAIPTRELSLFINALTVSCMNPYDFFGVDLMAELRSRVDNENFINPFAILTLCNAKDTMTSDHAVKLQQQFYAHHRPLWTDIQALTTMALACISSHSDVSIDDRIINEMAMELKRRQFRNGTVDNLRSTALVVQALLATDSYQREFDLESAMQYILNEINHKYVPITDLYYILPILNTMSLVNITSDHCVTPIKTDLEVLKKLSESSEGRIQVQFEMYIGDDMDFGRTWKLKVPSNYNFYQILETVGSLEPSYKAQYSVSEGKPYVRGLANFFDDASDGMYWFIYTQSLSSTSENLTLVEKSPVDIPVKEAEELILWYRSKVWDNSP